MRVHHFKIDNTQVPVAAREVSFDSMAITGNVTDGGKPVPYLPVKSYLVSDRFSLRVILKDESTTDGNGAFSFMLEPDQLYMLKAGVDEQTWRSSGGLHGGTVIDLHFPDSACGINIPIEHL